MPKPPLPYGDQPVHPCEVPVEFYDTGEARRTAAGLTVRDWLAANAPAEVPPWFEHSPPPKDGLPPRPDVSAIPDDENRGWASAYLSDPGFDLPPELADFGQAAKAYWKGQAEWRKANNLARCAQWAYAWADAMLAARKGE